MATTPTAITPPNCPECGHRMHKCGFVWAGRTRKQKWQCPKDGRITIKVNHNGSSPEGIPTLAMRSKPLPQEITMPMAGGEVSFTVKHPHICPVNLKPEANAQGCSFYNKGLCDRLTYPFGCRLGLTQEKWDALPTG